MPYLRMTSAAGQVRGSPIVLWRCTWWLCIALPSLTSAGIPWSTLTRSSHMTAGRASGQVLQRLIASYCSLIDMQVLRVTPDHVLYRAAVLPATAQSNASTALFSARRPVAARDMQVRSRHQILLQKTL